MNLLPDNRLRKTERLTKSKPIEILFKDGNELFSYPFKLIWQKVEGNEFPAKAMFVVPKKKFKHAVKRNFYKRRMREAYRTNKVDLYNTLKELNLNINLGIIFLGNESVDSEQIHKNMKKLLKKLVELLKV